MTKTMKVMGDSVRRANPNERNQRTKEPNLPSLISVIILAFALLVAPDVFDFSYTGDTVSSDALEEILVDFDGNNYEVLPDLKRIPVDFIEASDGDTVTLALDGEQLRVRYLIIDTPEMNYRKAQGPEPFAEEALERNRNLLESAEQVYIELDVGPETDDYGRLLAYVYADDIMVNEALIEEGLGKVRYVNPPNNSYEEALRKAEDKARAEEVNLWQ